MRYNDGPVRSSFTAIASIDAYYDTSRTLRTLLARLTIGTGIAQALQ